MEQRNIFIISGCGYSLNNRGDYAMLKGFVRFLESSGLPMSNVVLYANDPTNVRPDLPVMVRQSPETPLSAPINIKNQTMSRLVAIMRGVWFVFCVWFYRAFRVSISSCQAYNDFSKNCSKGSFFVFSGGGYLNSVWWKDGLYSKAFCALAGRIAGARLIMTSQGLGPIRHRLDRAVLGILLRSSEYIGIRQLVTSRELVNSLIGESKKLHFSWDDALAMRPLTRSDIENLHRKFNIDSTREFLVVNCRDSSVYAEGNEGPQYCKIASAIDKFLDVCGREFNVLFVPISFNQGDDDRASASQVIQCMRHKKSAISVLEEISPEEIKALVAGGALALGTSYHFLLFALSSGIPAVGVYQDEYYSDKLDGLKDLFGEWMKIVCSLDVGAEEEICRQLFDWSRDLSSARKGLLSKAEMHENLAGLSRNVLFNILRSR